MVWTRSKSKSAKKMTTKQKKATKEVDVFHQAPKVVSPLAIETASINNNDGGETKNVDSIFVKKGFASGSLKGVIPRHDDEDQWENTSVPCIEASSTGATTPTSAASGGDMSPTTDDDCTVKTDHAFYPSSNSNNNNNTDAKTVPSVCIGENQLVSPSESSTLTQSPSMIEKNANVKDTDSPSKDQGGDIYVSKEDLVLLMPSETYEEYESLVQDERDQKRADRELRKKMIQQELDTLLRLMQDNEMDDGQDLEPEAEEALGIAANRVCYLKKYYDVARCDYVFVPSVAYTIMDGTLLEEASKHYYGQSEEFLVTYAAALGTAVLSQKNYKDYLNIGPKVMEMAEDIDLAEHTPKNGQKNETVSDLFLGVVSPRNISIDEKDWDSAISSESMDREIAASKKGLTKKQIKKLKLAAGLYCFLATVFSVVMFYLNPQGADWNILDVNEDLFLKSPIVLVPRKDPLALSSKLEVLAKTEEASPAMKMLTTTEMDVAPQSMWATLKRPIAANLLYHH